MLTRRKGAEVERVQEKKKEIGEFTCIINSSKDHTVLYAGTIANNSNNSCRGLRNCFTKSPRRHPSIGWVCNNNKE